MFRLSITVRLFIAVLLTATLVSGAGLMLLHRNMQEGFTSYVAKVELSKLDGVVKQLTGYYAYHHAWPEGSPEQQQRWLREIWASSRFQERWRREQLREMADHSLSTAWDFSAADGNPDTGPSNPNDLNGGVNGGVTGKRPSSLTGSHSHRHHSVPALPADKQHNRENQAVTSAQNLSAPAGAATNGAAAESQPSLLSPETTVPQVIAASELPPYKSPSSNGSAPLDPPPPVVLKGPDTDADRLGLGSRLGLLDVNGNPIAGRTAIKEAPRRPILLNKQIIGYLTLIPAADPQDSLSAAFFSDQAEQLVWIGLFSILVSALAALVLATHFRAPIRLLVQAARRLTTGKFDTHVDVHRSDELGTLADAMNQLAQMLDQHETSRRQWVADTSHELRTPVAVLQAQIEAMQDGVRPTTADNLEALKRQVLGLSKLINDLHLLSRADLGQLPVHHQLVAVDDVVRDRVERFSERFAQKPLTLTLCSDMSANELVTDPQRLGQVIDNMLENSFRYTDAPGEVRLSIQWTATSWVLLLEDSPPGVPAEMIPRLGERFYRVDVSRNRSSGGTGLGLALCRQLSVALGGSLEFAPSRLGGLQTRLELPRVLAQ